MSANNPQNYVLSQRGRARVDFLIELGLKAKKLEIEADEFARQAGLTEATGPADLSELSQRISPIMQSLAAFRIFRLVREWQLSHHGDIAMQAFEEIRNELEPGLRALQQGTTTVDFAGDMKPPEYWDGYEFHRSAGGWDGHDYMGFVHGEIIHRKMVGDSFAGIIMRQRRDTAGMAPVNNPAKILELGCGSGQYTIGLAAAFPEADLWACDLSPRQLEQAQRRANFHGYRWHLFQAAAEDTGLLANQFDLVTSYAMFHELPLRAMQSTLKEALRVLKPGGVVFIADVTPYHVQNHYNRWKADLLNYVQGGDPFWREYATNDLAELAQRAGLGNASWSAPDEQQYPFILRAEKPAVQDVLRS